MNADLIENRADWLSRPVCSVILYTTVTQYIPIAVKSAYPSNPVIVAFTLYLKYFSQVDLIRYNKLRKLKTAQKKT